MALKKQKFSKAPVSTKVAVIATTISLIIFAAIGYVYYKNSSAASVTNAVGYYNYASIANLGGSVFISYDEIPGIGQQTVGDVGPGGKLSYVMAGKAVPKQTCYVARAFSSPKAPVPVTSVSTTFVGIKSSTTYSLPVDGNYHQLCLYTGTSAQLPYNVYNRSSAAAGYVLVYQTTVYY
jgi:hypothetical protein